MHGLRATGFVSSHLCFSTGDFKANDLLGSSHPPYQLMVTYWRKHCGWLEPRARATVDRMCLCYSAPAGSVPWTWLIQQPTQTWLLLFSTSQPASVASRILQKVPRAPGGDTPWLLAAWRLLPQLCSKPFTSSHLYCLSNF